MLATVTWILDLALAAYLVVECAKSPADYRRLKAAIARGEPGARVRFYRKAIVFEWIACALAAASLLSSPHRLRAAAAALADLESVQRLARILTQSSSTVGVFVGFAIGTAIALGVQRLIAARTKKAAAGAIESAAMANTTQSANDSKPAAPEARPAGALGRLRSLWPDFSALLPTNRTERWTFAAVAISAGICEEVVFRGWLLGAAHERFGLTGKALLAVGAIGFGLAHAYQGPLGVLLTGYMGAVFVGLFGATGSLVVPIVLHALVDLRFVFAPASKDEKPPVDRRSPVLPSQPWTASQIFSGGGTPGQ